MKELQVQIYTNKEFGEIRTLEINGEPWFVGKDVAEKLGYKKTRNAISSHVDIEDKKDAPIQGDLGGVQNMTIINESGLYSLILSSKLPNAKKFKKWVTSEVLPSIRKTGSYGVPQISKKQQLQLEILNGGELERIQALGEYTTLITDEATKPLLEKIEKDKPLVSFATQVTNSSDCIDVGQFAKIIKDENISIGRNKLFKWVRESGYLMNNNTPYQKYIDNNYFKVIEVTKETAYGVKTYTKTLVTGKGQVCILEKLREIFG